MIRFTWKMIFGRSKFMQRIMQQGQIGITSHRQLSGRSNRNHFTQTTFSKVKSESHHTDNFQQGQIGITSHRQLSARSNRNHFTQTIFSKVKSESLHTDNFQQGQIGITTHRQLSARSNLSRGGDNL